MVLAKLHKRATFESVNTGLKLSVTLPKSLADHLQIQIDGTQLEMIFMQTRFNIHNFVDSSHIYVENSSFNDVKFVVKLAMRPRDSEHAFQYYDHNKCGVYINSKCSSKVEVTCFKPK